MTTNTEQSITHIWERFNFQWIKAGAVTGLLAGTIMMAIACFVADKTLGEWTQPFKLLGAGIYGGDALEYGQFGMAGVYGLMLHIVLSLLYGIAFAQLMDENSSARSLFILAIVTSLIIWVFGGCLFMPSFNRILRNALSIPFNLALHVVFGVSFGLIIPIVRNSFLKKSGI